MQPRISRTVVVTTALSIVVSSLFGAGAAYWAVRSGAAGWQPDGGADNQPPQQVVQVEEQSAVTDVVKRVSPSVVSVIATKELPKLERFYYNPFGGDDFFNQFFGGQDFLVPGTRQNGTERREVGGGTGFVISKDGLIVTNKHVVLDTEADYSVLMNDEQTYDAEVLARDPVNDLAILKIDAHDLPTVELGDSDALEVGQSAIAIGNALGEFRNTVSTGVISGLSRSITAGGGSAFSEQLTNVIQTDASINPGNSGGPLLNIAGQVVGINTAVATGAQGIGFAIPINAVKSSIESVRENGRIVRPWLGVRYVMLNDAIAERNNLSITEGALIVRGTERTDLAVIPGSPAAKAGLKENDIITKIDDTALTSKQPLAQVLSQYSPGDTITVTRWRDGEEEQINVTLEEFTQ